MLSFCFFFFKQKTAYEMRISDWSSDVCSSDLLVDHVIQGRAPAAPESRSDIYNPATGEVSAQLALGGAREVDMAVKAALDAFPGWAATPPHRSEEHTSELQSLMRISYAVFCLKKKKQANTRDQPNTNINAHK